MRTESPIHYDEDSKVWSVFRYDDVKRVISDKDFFKSIPSAWNWQYVCENDDQHGSAETHENQIDRQQGFYTARHEGVGAAHSRTDE